MKKQKKKRIIVKIQPNYTLEKFQNKGFYTKEEAQKLISHFDQQIPQINYDYPDISVSKLKLHKTKNEKYLTTSIWKDLTNTVVPKCEFIEIIISSQFTAKHYIIPQSKLNEILRKKCHKNPTGYFIYEETNQRDTIIQQIIEKSSLLSTEHIFPHIHGFNIPATERYSISFQLFDQREGDRQEILLFHRKPSLKPHEDAYMYRVKVNPNETLLSVIRREINQITGRDKFEVIGIFEQQQPQQLPRYIVNIRIPYFKTDGKKFRNFNDNYMTWHKVKTLNS